MLRVRSLFSILMGLIVTACLFLSLLQCTQTSEYSEINMDSIDVYPRNVNAKLAVIPLPVDRGGQDLLGTVFPHNQTLALLESPVTPGVYLYRWWTEGCKYCMPSMAAIESLRQAYGERGLETVCVFHPKPRRLKSPPSTEVDRIIRLARSYGYFGPVAFDHNWRHLESTWLTSGQRQATSVTFLVDAGNIIRFVHPGPEFRGDNEGRAMAEHDDYLALESAVKALLGIAPPG